MALIFCYLISQSVLQSSNPGGNYHGSQHSVVTHKSWSDDNAWTSRDRASRAKADCTHHKHRPQLREQLHFVFSQPWCRGRPRGMIQPALPSTLCSVTTMARMPNILQDERSCLAAAPLHVGGWISLLTHPKSQSHIAYRHDQFSWGAVVIS